MGGSPVQGVSALALDGFIPCLSHSLLSMCDPDMLEGSFSICGGRSEGQCRESLPVPMTATGGHFPDVWLLQTQRSLCSLERSKAEQVTRAAQVTPAQASIRATSRPAGRSQNMEYLGSKAPQSAPRSCCDSRSPGDRS